MLTNFEIHDLIYVYFDGHEIDLHNEYDFIAEKVMITKTEIRLLFQKTDNLLLNPPFEFLQFNAYNYSYLLNKAPDQDQIWNDTCIDGITYYPSSEREIHNALIDQRAAKEEDDLIFNFMSNRIIRIGAERIILEGFNSASF